ncbi:C-C motif chemokine 19 [Columba guinea]|nr:C-C motif chemokine 19 [Columba guinea]
MALRLLLPLLLLAATLITAQAQGTGSSALDCCLKHSKKAVPRNLVKSYRLQGPELGCMLHAVVLLVIGCILDVHGGNNVLDCCLRTKETPIPWRIVQDYRLQLVQDGCNIPATV